LDVPSVVTEQSTLVTQHSPPNATAGHPKGQTLTTHAAFPSPIFGYSPNEGEKIAESLLLSPIQAILSQLLPKKGIFLSFLRNPAA